MNKETIDRIRKFSEDRDWDQFHGPANLAKSIVIENKMCISEKRIWNFRKHL